MKTVLFVCTGNICRSPMAEGLLRNFFKNRTDMEIVSAGIAAQDGYAPSLYAVDVMRELGIDISGLRSRGLSSDLVRKADVIFVMTYGHLDSLLLQFPFAADKIFLLREFEKDVPALSREVADPIGQSVNIYRSCRDQIHAALPRLAELVLSLGKSTQQKPNMTSSSPSSQKPRIILGADHGGIELKAALRAWLEERQYPVEDIGAFSSESVDYPDYADKAGHAVAAGQAEFGILVCKSGIGMAIAANRIPEVRAALIFNTEMARLARAHNNANILCLSANETKAGDALKILETWLATSFEGGRHARRVQKLEAIAGHAACASSPKSAGAPPSLAVVDPQIFKAIADENQRQRQNIELIASENFTSRAVMEAQGSSLTNKYAEGYPGKRWYGGTEHVDVAEQLAIDRAKELFGAEHANVQPHSGAQANMVVYFAFLEPGDPILAMELAHGGHLTHGHPKNFSGRYYKVEAYGVRRDTEMIDYDDVHQKAVTHKPKMITVGASAYSRFIDFKRMREIADEVGALLFVDMAHIAGLVAAGVHPSPVPYADFVTTTTHKTLRGPRGGIVLCKEKYAKEIDSQLFPGVQGGPLMHVIAAKAACLKEALEPGFKEYQKQVVRNAKALASHMQNLGYRIVSGGTDNHLMLVDLQPKKITGKEAQEALDQVNITVNKNTVPFDTTSPFKSGGIRLGTPAVTTRGVKEKDIEQIAQWIDAGLTGRKDAAAQAKLRTQVAAWMEKFPLPY